MSKSVTPAVRLAPQLAYNLLVNSGFEIWQRGTNFPFVAASGMTGDEWFAASPHAGDSLTVSRDTGSLFGSYALKAVAVCSNEWCAVRQGFESSYNLAGRYVTFSVYLKGTGTVEMIIYGRHGGGTYWQESISVTLTGSYTLYNVVAQIPVDQDFTYGGAYWPHSFALNVDVEAIGTNATWYMDGASLVVGEYRNGVDLILLNAAEDLLRCQRFYEYGHATLAGWTNTVQGLPYPVSFNTNKASAPTVSTSLTFSSNLQFLGVSTVDEQGFTPYMLANGAFPTPVDAFFDWAAEVT